MVCAVKDESRTQAVIFDFNGTLSDDEPVLLQVFTELFEEHLGWRLSTVDYFERLAGHSDREIIELAVTQRIGRAAHHPELVSQLLAARRERYLQLVDEECPIRDRSQQLVHALADANCPMAIVTGAQRADVDFVLSRSNVGQHFKGVVTEEDVQPGKPHPEGFLRGAQLLGIKPTDILVFEDSVVGIRAAQAAEMRCVGVIGTHDAATLADEGVHTVEQLGPELIALL